MNTLISFGTIFGCYSIGCEPTRAADEEELVIWTLGAIST